MRIYEIVYEQSIENGGIRELVFHVESPDFITAAQHANDHAEQYGYDIKYVRYFTTVVERLVKTEKSVRDTIKAYNLKVNESPQIEDGQGLEETE